MTFSVGVVDDRDKGVLKRYQMSSATSGDLLTGQSLGAMVTSATQVVLVVLTGVAFGFNPIGGAPGLIAGIFVAFIFALFAVGLGLIIGALVKTTGAATGVALTIVMVMAFFSGFSSHSNPCPQLQQAAIIFPSYYANDAVKSLVARGASILAPQVLYDIGILCVFSVVVYLIGCTFPPTIRIEHLKKFEQCTR